MSAGKFLIPYCFAKRLSLIFTKSTPNESVSSSIFSSSAKTVSHVTQLRASKRVFIKLNHRQVKKVKNRFEVFKKKIIIIVEVFCVWCDKKNKSSNIDVVRTERFFKHFFSSINKFAKLFKI